MPDPMKIGQVEWCPHCHGRSGIDCLAKGGDERKVLRKRIKSAWKKEVQKEVNDLYDK